MQKNVSLTETAQDWRNEIILSPLVNFSCCSQQPRDRQLIPRAESETLLPSAAALVLKTIRHVRFSQSASNEIHGFVRAFDVLFRDLCVAVLLASPALRRIARNRIEKVRVARAKWLLLKSKALTNLNNLYEHRGYKSFFFKHLYTQNYAALFCVLHTQNCVV